jgi:hypothetical protein
MATTTVKDVAQLAKLDVAALFELETQGAITKGELTDVLGHKLAQEARIAREAQEARIKAEQEARDAKANGGGVKKAVKEVVSTKPGWVTVRYTGRGFPTSGSVATWEALLDYLDKNADKVRSIVKAVRDVGDDDKSHRKLACYSAAKEAKD